jgi:pimeloyl-ACP methyl ester carboxylesterase
VFPATAPPAAPAPPLLDRRVGPRRARAHCVEFGPQDAPLALLIHGLGGLAEEIAAPLHGQLAAAGFRVLAVDRPGYGASDPQPAHRMSPSAQAVWLASLLERLQLEPAVIVGHSFGAAVALWLGRRLARAAPALVLVNPFCRPTPPALAPLLRLSVAPGVGPVVRRKLAPRLAEPLVRAGLHQAFAPDPPTDTISRLPAQLMTQESVLLAMAAELRGFNADASRMGAEGWSPQRPVIALTGLYDRVISGEAHGTWLERRVGRVDHRRVACGHMIHHTRPELVAEAVAEAA